MSALRQYTALRTGRITAHAGVRKRLQNTNRCPMRTALRTKILLLVILLAALAYVATTIVGEDEPPPLPYEEHRTPVSNPPVDPNRPDLFEEPVIDPQDP